METWATFSIIDHRKPFYRQALALFDRIVVPIPSRPIGDQTAEELNQLSAEVDALFAAKAAVRYEWDIPEFEQWRAPLLAESLAANIDRDPFLDTRLMLAEHFKDPEKRLESRLMLGEQFDFQEVEAVPVYGSLQSFSQMLGTMGGAEQALTVEIMQTLPVPNEDTPLENLIRLRQSPAFRNALDELLEWKRNRAPAIVLTEDKGRKRAIEAAMRDFNKLTKAYAEAMEAEGHKKAGSVGSILFALFTGEPIGAVKETLVSFRELREPCWKKLSDRKCAPGAVVYHFQEAMR